MIRSFRYYFYFFVYFLSFVVFNLFPQNANAQDEYSFELTEIEKKPYSIDGYIEFQPVLFFLDRDASIYKLRFFGRDKGDRIEEYNFTLQLDGSYEKGITNLYIKTNTDITNSYLGWSEKTTIFEGYLSLNPSFSLGIDMGKRTLKWGKGYAWNPVAFVDRAKDPDDPELALEGFIVASVNYIKSFSGALKTVSLTNVLIPVYEHINDSFGEIDSLNFAAKLYLLLYDTDIDFIILTGGSKTTRYGFDFSRNIASNFEIHGEFALINNFEKRFVDRNGHVFEKQCDAKSFLLGIRYLTELDTTYIVEYYHNGTGFSGEEMRDYFSFVDKAYETFTASGDDGLLKEALILTEGNYGRRNPMRDYLYLRASQKEPFNILYFTPSLTWVYNFNDRSFSLSQEILYSPVTNLELRSKITVISGGHFSEYGEKQNDYRVEFRARYFFNF